MEKAYVTLKAGQMHYLKAGSGAPLLLVHMSGSSCFEFDQVIDELAENYTVYAPDFFGCGYSDKQPKFYYSIQEHADSLAQFLDGIGVASAYVYGTAVGGNVCCRMAATYPEKVRGLITGHICYNPDRSFFPGMRHLELFSPLDIKEDGSHLNEMWKRSYRYGVSKEISDFRALTLHEAGRYAETLHWALCDDRDFEDCLPRITAPALMLIFERLTIPSMPGKAAELMPNGTSRVMPDTSSYFAKTHPEQLIAVIREFFK